MKKIKSKLGKFLLKATLYFFGITIGLVVLYRFIPVPFTPLMFIRSIEQIQEPDRSFKWKKDWEPVLNISKNLQLAVVCSEDQQFLNHMGFDFKAIEKAMKHNKKSKRIKGASTISQQTAKNVFLWPGRSWIRKGFEVYFTTLIELIWSKERIIEVYLNVIEYGDGVYGAEAAANEFFHKSAANLKASEAATLAAVLPNPFKYKAGAPSSYVKKRQRWILRQMAHWGWDIDFDAKELEKESDDEPEEE